MLNFIKCTVLAFWLNSSSRFTLIAVKLMNIYNRPVGRDMRLVNLYVTHSLCIENVIWADVVKDFGPSIFQIYWTGMSFVFVHLL